MTGFLLAGIGERNVKGDSNFLIVNSSEMFKLATNSKEIEETFRKFLKTPNVAVILVNQHVSISKLDRRKRTQAYNQ